MKFDIILPTIGRDSLKSSIESVIAQEYQDWLLYVIADRIILSDAWPTLLDDRIIVYEICDLPDHMDYGARARNFGIEQGDGPWIAYIDDDDLWSPIHLSTMVELSQSNPEANMIRTAGTSFALKHKHPRSSKKRLKITGHNTTDILTVGMAHTRELFSKTSGWQPHDNHDLTLWREMEVRDGVAVSSDSPTFLFKR